MILQFDLHNFAVLAWQCDEDGEPVYCIVKQGIKAAKIAATLARKFHQGWTIATLHDSTQARSSGRERPWTKVPCSGFEGVAVAPPAWR